VLLIVSCCLYSAEDEIYWESYSFRKEKKLIQGDFGRILVPENRTKPDPHMIEVAFLRLESLSKNPGPPIMLLAGGPGGSGIETLKRFKLREINELREFGDLIAIEQRVTRSAKPVMMSPMSWNLPLDMPGNPDEWIEIEKAMMRKTAEYYKKQGRDIHAYNTIENAADVNDVRIALGAEKMILFGGSYGSHLSLTVIRHYGKYVHKAIIGLPEPMNHSYKLPSNVDKGLYRLAELVKENPELNKLIPDFIGLVKEMLAQLEESPVVWEVKDSKLKSKVKIMLGKWDLQKMTSEYLGRTPSARNIPALYYTMSQGDFSELAKFSYRMRAGRKMSLNSVVCDAASGATKERLEQIARESKTSILGDAINYPFPMIGEAVGSPDLGDEFRSNFQSDVRILFFSGTMDIRTPPSNVDEIIDGFSNADHVRIKDRGHGVTDVPEVFQIFQEFLKDEPISTHHIVPEPLVLRIPKKD
jgi:pimeloyl-ACP methyl ester carboxylesterase